MNRIHRHSHINKESGIYVPFLASHILFIFITIRAVCLSLSLSSFVFTNAVNGAYASAGHLIYLLQMAQFLEVTHGAIGLVPSGVVLPLRQWAGRSTSVFITFVAWSLSEVIRYPHYAFNCTGSCPSWITYLRCTAFIVLYPPGMAGETWLTYQALPFINKKSLSPHFSAGISFCYYNFLRVLLVCYLFLLSILTVGSR
ncbi:very-long-chain (3R)-3-hydroxyacyl-[acyl-carrier protein] dehydratase 2 [Pyrus ussuriensis x Pyrus communis]|uniref:Very-long-chain (3R)-3-hydroxyacyl-CoA dehydratase n=1 Tax=Pyrus ussuriensis x Pyrus communis TaxID=2448454 RepID=A0A5N5FUL1_9ROSA|nr:very-long-chain (3R)-3-hydroxyacyl-[acyl-carrier protein] dehydratase 2 [Pyrus ussuriensis x Pyrus communis]